MDRISKLLSTNVQCGIGDRTMFKPIEVGCKALVVSGHEGNIGREVSVVQKDESDPVNTWLIAPLDEQPLWGYLPWSDITRCGWKCWASTCNLMRIDPDHGEWLEESEDKEKEKEHTDA